MARFEEKYKKFFMKLKYCIPIKKVLIWLEKKKSIEGKIFEKNLSQSTNLLHHSKLLNKSIN